MSLILSSFTISAPLLLLLAIGAFLNKLKFTDKNAIDTVSKIILKVLLPINMFLNIYDGDLKAGLAFDFFIVLFGGYAICILLNIFIVIKTSLTARQKSAIIQNAIRPNLAMFALPLSIEMAGDSIKSLASISAGTITPFINAFAIGEFECFNKESANKLEIIKKVFSSPLVVASILGFIYNLLNISLPYVCKRTMSYCSNCVTPMSLIMIGASFDFSLDKSDIKKISYSVLFKTVFCPVVGLLLALLFKLSADQLVVILCCFASPTAASSFATANDYDTDMKLINSSLVYSYVACIFTLPLIISVSKALSIIN